ncbi:MAG: fluoride efflux transporter CrcB [Chitinophagaceae bacterium]|nr:fluoride efflux transporter CrcB [Chitinophagaceae bacterium]
MLKALLLVAFGGATGSILRYLTYYLIPTKTFNWATLLVNIIGSLLIGLLAGYLTKITINNNWHLVLIVGFCGGFTTYSAFSWDILQLFQQQKIFLAICYAIAMLVLGLLFTFIGYSITK